MNGTGRNYYSVLEVSRHSTAMEIRQAYKKVSKKLHPDKNPSPNADAMFQEVKVAYDVSLH
jgi:molecular chaperone DnaJ